MESFHHKEIKRFLKLSARAHEKNNLKEESEYCNALGNEYLQLGEYEEALSMHQKELALCKALNDKIGQAVANRKIGDVYGAMDNYTNALKHHYKYLDLAENDDVELQRATTSLGKTFLDYSRTIEDHIQIKQTLIKSIEFLNKSLKLTEMIKGKVQERETYEMKIRSLINLGLCHHQLSGISASNEERSKSETYFQKAIYLSQKHNFKEDLFLAYYVITSVNLEQKQYTSALRNCQSALSLAEKINNKKSIIEALILQGQVDLLMGNTQGAKSCFLRAFKMKNKQDRGVIEEQLKLIIKLCQLQEQIKLITDKYMEFRMHETMADILCKLQCFSLAVEHYKHQENLMSNFDADTLNEKQKRSVYFSIATTLFDIGEYKESKDYHFKELEVTEDKAECSKTWSYIAACYEKSGESFNEIESAYKNAIECATDANDKRLQLKTLSVFNSAQSRNLSSKEEISATREKINNLENELGVLAEDSEDDEEELCENSCPMEDDIELLLQQELENFEIEEKPEDNVQRGSRRNPKLNKKNDKGETLLHRACIEGDLKKAESLITQGHELSPRDYCGWTPLHEACNYGHFDIIKLLVNKGARVNDRGGDLCQSITPINDAATNGHFEIVNFLLDKGANPNIASSQGATVLSSLKNFYRLHDDDMDLESKQNYTTLCERLKSSFKQQDTPEIGVFEQELLEEKNDHDFSDIPNLDEPVLPTLTSRVKENRNKNSLIDYKSHNSLSDDVLEYKHSIASLGGSTARSNIDETQNVRSPAVKRRSNTALIPEDQNPVNDWLIPIEDDISQPIKKQRVQDKKVSQSTTKQSTKKRRSSKITDYCSTSSEVIDLECFNDDFYVENDVETTKTKPIMPTPITTQIITQPANTTFRLKVKIEEITFMVAVTNKGETIGELTLRAASKYEKVKSRQPNLSLYTTDDCLLSDEDLIVDVLSNNDMVIGKVNNWHVVKFSEMYTNACKKSNSLVIPRVLQACQDCECTKTLEIKNIFTYDLHLKPLFSIIGLQDIQKVILYGNRIGLEGLKAFCTAISNCIKTDSILNELNMGLTDIPEDSISHLSNCSILRTLTHLNLSFNPLNNSNKLLSMILNNCGKLKSLNISHCGLTFFNSTLLPTLSKFDHLEILDISDNLFGWQGIQLWFKLLNREVIKHINIGAVSNKNTNSKLLNAIHEFVITSETVIHYLGIEENSLTADHLNQFTLSSNYFEQINISNNNLTLSDLKLFVNQLPYCSTKWLY